MLLGQGANFLLQAGYFILLARLLGVTEYGVFAGTFALVNMVTPYSALGSAMLFMRYVSADHSQAGVYWGNALLITSVISVLMAGSFFFLGPALTNIHNGLIFVVLVFANCLFSQISLSASSVLQTFEKMRATAALSFLSNLARFLTLMVLQIMLHHATAFQWSIGVLIASGLAAIASMIWVRSEIGPSRFNIRLLFRRASEGVGFSFAGTTQAVYNDVDKTMLSHYGLNRENGFYTLAYRIVDFAATPISAIDAAILPRIFRLSRDNMGKVVRLAAKSAAAAVLVGAIIAIGILVVAPVVPHLVGRQFAGVLIALRWLCWIPLLRGIHRMTGGALTGSGHQNLRTAAQFAVAGMNFLLNLWWIPVYGWIGAAWSSVASDGLLAVLNSLLLLWVSKRVSYRQATVIPNGAES
jgi:O-antigen/teichoic acid export membrane protein